MSTFFTLVRIILIPFIILTIIRQKWALSLILFIFAALTDVLDGFLARLLKEETILGAYLDPVADKLLLLSGYIAFFFTDLPYNKIPIWFIFLMFLKEILLIGGAIFLTIYGHATSVKPTFLGKFTTILQVTFLAWLFISLNFQIKFSLLFNIFLFLITLLNGVTFLQYAFISFRRLSL